MTKTTIFHEPQATLVRLENSRGAVVELTDIGARVHRICVPDREGQMGNVVVGCERPEDYLTDTLYRGATIGRVANRIGQARFRLGDQLYTLDRNDGRHCNHGGPTGFSHRRWQLLPQQTDGVTFAISSPDGEGGFPGNVELTATFRWDDDCRLTLRLHGTVDRPTYLNPTNHTYFNLSGRPGSVLGHLLRISGEQIVETDDEFIPTGQLLGVANTPFDFRQTSLLGLHIPAFGRICNPISLARGYNHCYAAREAWLSDPSTGRTMHVETTLPGLLLYTAGWCPQPFEAVCLEAQFWPDTPNQPHFPSCLTSPGHDYDHTISYHFGVER